jgi:hypothetical protein
MNYGCDQEPEDGEGCGQAIGGQERGARAAFECRWRAEMDHGAIMGANVPVINELRFR